MRNPFRRKNATPAVETFFDRFFCDTEHAAMSLESFGVGNARDPEAYFGVWMAMDGDYSDPTCWKRFLSSPYRPLSILQDELHDQLKRAREEKRARYEQREQELQDEMDTRCIMRVSRALEEQGVQLRILNLSDSSGILDPSEYVS